MNGLTLLAHRRPEYLAITLDALARCAGIDEWQVTVLMDRPDGATRQLVAQAGFPAVTLTLGNGEEPAYSRISRATLLAFAVGFATADYVVHLEEDCVAARDFLMWNAMMAILYRDDPSVFSVSSWWPAPPEWGASPPEGADARHDLGHIPPNGIATWGIGTWVSRWPDVRANWDLAHWDRNLARDDRLTVHPLVSRVKNIGRIGTQPVEEHDWRNATQTPAFHP